MLHVAMEAGHVLAQESESASGSDFSFLFILVIMGGLFYLLLIRPQRKRQRQMQELVQSIEVGDEVRTVGGIYGRVETTTDADIIIDVGNGTTLRIARRAIAERLGVTEE